MKKAVVLFSGGLDSSTVLAQAIQQGFECHCLSFDYGQRHRVELEAGERIAKTLGATSRQVININLAQFGGSALTDDRMTVPDYSDRTEIPVTYVPARNLVFLSLAVSFAETLGAEALFIGASQIDYSGYPDCRDEFLRAFERTANLGTQAGTSGKPLTLFAPLLNLSKADTIKLGLSLGVDYSQTISCYQATNKGLACGRCDSCTLRRNGFEKAGISDPTHYV